MNPVMYAKAIIGGLAALLGALAVGLAEGGLSSAEIVGALATGLTAAGAVFKVTNKTTPAGPPD